MEGFVIVLFESRGKCATAVSISLMSVVVLLFGPHAAALGRDRAVVVLGDDATCHGVLTALRTQYPQLAALMPAARLAVNSRFGSSETEVNTTDELALIALVAGG